MSTIPFPGFLHVANLCALAGADVSQLNPGCLAYVESEDSYFRLMGASAAPAPAPDGVYVVSVPGGPQTPGCAPIVGTTADKRRWVLTTIADAAGVTANSLAWFIDAVNGNDNNTGTDIAHPLKTARELGLRWERGAGYNTTGAVVVTILSDHLLADDTILVRRPVSAKYPIVFQYPTRPATAGASPLGGATNVDPTTNQLWTLDFAPAARPALNKYVRFTSGPASGAWAYLSLNDLLVATADHPTGFTMPMAYDTTAAVAHPADLAPSVGQTYEILGAGCLIPDTFIIDIDPGSEVWFFDMEVRAGAGTAPYAIADIKSGGVRFVRCDGNAANPPTVGAREDAYVTIFSSASNHFTFINADGTAASAVQFLTSYVALTASSLINRLVFQGDNVTAPAAFVNVFEGQYCQVYGLAVSQSTGIKFNVYRGSIDFNSTLYGKDNLGVLLNMSNWAKGAYADQALLTVAQGPGNVVSTAVIDYQNGVTKTFALADLPFVSNATASDSQAGMLLQA